MSLMILELVMLLHFSTCLFMTGLIWLIQVVHYPAFSFVDEHKFRDFTNFHGDKISLIVIPVMCIEVLSGLYVYFQTYTSQTGELINIIGLALIWGVTFFMSVPYHVSLNQNFSKKLIQGLVSTNWFRTILWTLRSILLFSLLFLKMLEGVYAV